MKPVTSLCITGKVASRVIQQVDVVGDLDGHRDARYWMAAVRVGVVAVADQASGRFWLRCLDWGVSGSTVGPVAGLAAQFLGNLDVILRGEGEGADREN